MYLYIQRTVFTHMYCTCTAKGRADRHAEIVAGGWQAIRPFVHADTVHTVAMQRDRQVGLQGGLRIRPDP